jgi:SAM-dependent methyltransferase
MTRREVTAGPDAPVRRMSTADGLFSREAMLKALGSNPPTIGSGPGAGLYRTHYLAHGADFWGFQPGAAVRWFLDRHDVLGWRVLDAGAGTGKNALEFARRGAGRVVAVEIDSVATRELIAALCRLEISGLLPENLVAVCKDDLLTHLQQTREDYDCVVSYGVLHVFKERDLLAAAIDLIRTAVRPGGYLVLQSLTNKYPAPLCQPELDRIVVDEAGVKGMVPEPTWSIKRLDMADIDHSHVGADDHHRHGSIRVVARRMK